MSGTVWILGAGFSRSLGGPLLPNLLTRPSVEHAAIVLGDQAPFLRSGEVEFILRTYQEGCDQRRWTDAEDFYEKLNSAVMAGSGTGQWEHFVRLLRIGRSDRLPEYEVLARRLLAAECAAFLIDANVSIERWQPYHRWLQHVERDDTVITFNYDRVLELLAIKQLQFALPGETPAPSNSPLVLKLHGSVDWKRTDRGFVVDDELCALTCSDEELAIATPGRAKQRMVQQFKTLWNLATNAIQYADRIAFIGYRFPPTDAQARIELLGAIRANDGGQLKIVTVLGPNTDAPDSKRLKRLLDYSMPMKGTRRIVQEPLYAEDFFSVLDKRFPAT